MDAFLAGNERHAYRMALIATSNREDALEIVQEAMLKLVKRYRHHDSEAWGPLFHRIVQSCIRDWYRRSKIRNGLRSLLGIGEPDDGGDLMDRFADTREAGPQDTLAEQQAMRALDQALHQLPLRQQQAFLLRHWQGLDVADTADAMGCSPGSVKTHLSRALGRLRELLEDYRYE
jgi:RNA polymerase sigma-70 factor (ECF subfamily)